MWKREPLLPDDEIPTLLEASEQFDLTHQVTIYTLIHTGMRADELAHLRDDWIDWQAERLRIPTESGDWTPKTKHSVRTIPIKHPPTIRRLRDYFGYHAEYEGTRQTVYNRVKRVADTADLRKKVTPHVLRHTYGNLIASKGASEQYIKQTMGHASLASSTPYIQFAGRQLDDEANELW